MIAVCVLDAQRDLLDIHEIVTICDFITDFRRILHFMLDSLPPCQHSPRMSGIMTGVHVNIHGCTDTAVPWRHPLD